MMMVASGLDCSLAAASTGLLHPSMPARCDPTFGLCNLCSTFSTATKKRELILRVRDATPLIVCCSEHSASTVSSHDEEEAAAVETSSPGITPPAIRRRRIRYRKQYPGEKVGITEEMRFVAMKLRNNKASVRSDDDDCQDSGLSNGGHGDTVADSDKSTSSSKVDEKDSSSGGETWQPSMEGFLKYLVDSKLVFSTVERIIGESDDVSYTHFRMTGLERSEGLLKDLEWFCQQDIVIPEPSIPGVNYAKYLEELAEKSPPLFLCHFYNLYFSHIAGGQVIAKQASEKLLEGRELEFYRWERDAEQLLKGVRQQLNILGEHWTRDEKNKCLREAKKSFQFLGQIVRLIIL